jgi:hypothetical protein
VLAYLLASPAAVQASLTAFGGDGDSEANEMLGSQTGSQQ